MRTRTHTRLVIVVMSALLAILSPLAVTPLQRATAQSNSGRFEMTGAITAMVGRTITVNARLVDISRARIRGVLAVGRLVKVEGTLLANGTVSARQVRVVSRNSRADNLNGNSNDNLNNNSANDNGNQNDNSNNNGDDHGSGGNSGKGGGKGGKD